MVLHWWFRNNEVKFGAKRTYIDRRRAVGIEQLHLMRILETWTLYRWLLLAISDKLYSLVLLVYFWWAYLAPKRIHRWNGFYWQKLAVGGVNALIEQLAFRQDVPSQHRRMSSIYGRRCLSVLWQFIFRQWHCGITKILRIQWNWGGGWRLLRNMLVQVKNKPVLQTRLSKM